MDKTSFANYPVSLLQEIQGKLGVNENSQERQFAVVLDEDRAEACFFVHFKPVREILHGTTWEIWFVFPGTGHSGTYLITPGKVYIRDLCAVFGSSGAKRK